MCFHFCRGLHDQFYRQRTTNLQSTEAFDRLDCDDSGFISAHNLREILGPEFPEDEIDAIIAEANSVDGKISYSDFLALWEEKNENERGKVIQDLMDVENDTCSVGSEENFEESVARIGFLEKKMVSNSKSARISAAASDDSCDGSRHVGFQEGVVIIPSHGDV